ncbi:MAG TPA: GspE/PulE family protein [Pseudomonadales bacterium]|nr:GspE/PulE family protein [Pseudomonadales bacterium]
MSDSSAIKTTASEENLVLDEVRIDPVVALRVPAALAMRRELLPFVLWQGKIHVACANPDDATGLASVQRHFIEPLCAVRAEPVSLRRALQRIYSGLKPGAASLISQTRLGGLTSLAKRPATTAPNSGGEELQAAALSEELLYAAILRQASDIHLDPDSEGLRVRFRVDGLLEDVQRLPSSIFQLLTNRFKVLAQMDISEKRAPQDGGFRHEYGINGSGVDIRAATLPTKWGERMTLRLLGLQTGELTLERLGMATEHLARFEAALSQPHGMILLTGPTGSGKSTTLYAGLRRLIERESLNVITIEDPIEYEIAGVAQVAVDSADKTSFDKALRSLLRHDPDVVMIGEIRDSETAGIAVKSSLTGHLVFSTLHTNSAAGAVVRLADMGVERYLIASTLRLAIAQRLVRRLCKRCRVPRQLTEMEARTLGRMESAGQRVFDSPGCLYCGGRGLIGRLALFEFLPLDESWSELVADGVNETELTAEMKRRRLPTLVDDALAKLAGGETSFSEVRNAVAIW